MDDKFRFTANRVMRSLIRKTENIKILTAHNDETLRQLNWVRLSKEIIPLLVVTKSSKIPIATLVKRPSDGTKRSVMPVN